MVLHIMDYPYEDTPLRGGTANKLGHAPQLESDPIREPKQSPLGA
jgi:hypothetical protein